MTYHLANEVYRVNFLRAKARHDRWDEELQLVRREMHWSIRYFVHQRQVWAGRAEVSTKEGHRAYAYKQAAMWENFECEGEVQFAGKMFQ